MNSTIRSGRGNAALISERIQAGRASVPASLAVDRPGAGSSRGRSPSQPIRAFSLLEVMIAVALFFMATFAILALVSRCIAQARALQPMQVDANMVAAELSLTNRLEEGPIPPEIIQHFEHMYPNYTCGGTITEVGTNGFFQVDIEVGGVSAGKHLITSKNSVYLFRPQSASRRGFGPAR